MPVRLTGTLICKDAGQAARVAEHLPRHIELTRAEPGCLSFDVEPTDDPLIWDVSEEFRDDAAHDLHQERTAASDWARQTAGTARSYVLRRTQ